jgi:hypothetical protein
MLPRTAKIALWYVPFAFLVFILYWTMPNKWRVHCKLQKFIPAETPQFEYIDTSVCLVGDCTAWLAPWPVARVFVAGQPPIGVIPAINRKADTYIVITGVMGMERPKREIDADFNAIKNAILAKYPSSTVLIVSPYVRRKIAKIEGAGDGAHINANGYNLLLALHPDVYLAIKPALQRNAERAVFHFGNTTTIARHVVKWTLPTGPVYTDINDKPLPLCTDDDNGIPDWTCLQYCHRQNLAHMARLFRPQ